MSVAVNYAAQTINSFGLIGVTWLVGVICSVASFLAAVCCPLFFIFVVPSCFPLSSELFFPHLYFLLSSSSFYFLFCSTANSVMCWLAYFCSFCPPRAHCGSHCMAKSPFCIYNVYKYLFLELLITAACDYRALLPLRHQHGHWLCRM